MPRSKDGRHVWICAATGETPTLRVLLCMWSTVEFIPGLTREAHPKLNTQPLLEEALAAARRRGRILFAQCVGSDRLRASLEHRGLLPIPRSDNCMYTV